MRVKPRLQNQCAAQLQGCLPGTGRHRWPCTRPPEVTYGQGPGAWVLCPPLGAWRRHQALECRIWAAAASVRSMPLTFGGSSEKAVVLDLLQREKAKKKRSGQVVMAHRTRSLLPGVTTQLTHAGVGGPIDTQRGWETSGTWAHNHVLAQRHTCMQTHMLTHASTGCSVPRCPWAAVLGGAGGPAPGWERKVLLDG